MYTSQHQLNQSFAKFEKMKEVAKMHCCRVPGNDFLTKLQAFEAPVTSDKSVKGNKDEN